MYDTRGYVSETRDWQGNKTTYAYDVNGKLTSTTRAASDLGFKVILPGDALLAFDIAAHDGGRIDPDTVLQVTLSLLGADFAQLVTTDQVAGLL